MARELVEQARVRRARERRTATLVEGAVEQPPREPVEQRVGRARVEGARVLGGIFQRSVTLAMPPKFKITAGRGSSANTRSSASAEIGAPSPPAAMSRCRKSLATAQPASSATKSPSPSWTVAAPLGSWPS